jgi:hypothetical protein
LIFLDFYREVSSCKIGFDDLAAFFRQSADEFSKFFYPHRRRNLQRLFEVCRSQRKRKSSAASVLDLAYQAFVRAILLAGS